jgi:hypothetical protein
MAAFDPENVREIAHQLRKNMGLRTLDEVTDQLENTLKRSDGPMVKQIEALLVVIRAAKEDP